jgi:hypothetical protein
MGLAPNISLPVAEPASLLTREEKEQELGALLRSGAVREHTHLHSLLTYLGRQSVEDPAQLLKEYTIGVEALGKPGDYDPRLDPTVRVEVARLRTRLREYYEGPGATHRVWLTIPKGGYMPAFVEGSRVTITPGVPPRASRVRHLWPALTVVLLAALAWQQWRTGRAAPALAPEVEAFWAPHFSGSTPTLIVYGAPLFLKVQNSFFRDTHVNRVEELDKSSQVRGVIGVLKPLEIRPIYHFTGLGEAEAIFYITRVLAAGNAQLEVKRSNAVSWDDLKNRHVVMIGGRKFNPQIPDLPFQPRFLAEKGKVFDLQARGNEPAEYQSLRKSSHGDVTDDFSIISVYPGFSSNTRFVTIESSYTGATLAAAEFVTRPDTLREVVNRNLPLSRSSPYRAFQVVVGSKLNNGVVVELSYVKHTVLP